MWMVISRKLLVSVAGIFIIGMGLGGKVAFGSAAAATMEAWNPTPAAGDLVFALPCDQKIVFRKIVTQELGANHAQVLDDSRVRLGSSDRQHAYIDYLRTAFIAGHFMDEHTRFFVLAKYETTAAQYKSVTGSRDCRISGQDEDMPASRLSWYDSVDFGRKLTAHLLSSQRDEVSRLLGTTKVYARLPTEIEWEFAARGGLSVSVAEFQAQRAPMAGDVKAYIWFNDPQSSRGELQPIGLLLPNPLGLHDMYGNVAEMMFEPFTLNKAGRSHGLAGGIILKGGSFQSNGNNITSAAREEDTLFDEETGEEKRRRTTGFRIALAGVALPTTAEVSRLADQWNAASQSTLPPSDDPMQLIAAMREANSDLGLGRELDAVEQSIRTELASGADRRTQLMTGLLINVGKNVADIRAKYQAVKNRSVLLRPEMSGAFENNGQGLQVLKTQVANDQFEIQDLNYFVHDTIVRMNENYEIGDLQSRARVVAAELQQRNLDGIASGVGIASQIAAMLKQGDRQYGREDVLSLAISGL
jgi:hypothetical protein